MKHEMFLSLQYEFVPSIMDDDIIISSEIFDGSMIPHGQKTRTSESRHMTRKNMLTEFMTLRAAL